MNAWLTKLIVAVLTHPDVQVMLAKLVRDAVDQANADVLTALGKMEHAFVDNLEQLPREILGDPTKTVAALLDAENFAKAIVEQMLGAGDNNKPPWWPW